MSLSAEEDSSEWRREEDLVGVLGDLGEVGFEDFEDFGAGDGAESGSVGYGLAMLVFIFQ